MVFLPRSRVAGIWWPALLDGHGSAVLALQFQLEQSQWWTASELRVHQLEQLALVVSHAQKTVPFYQRLYAGLEARPTLSEEALAKLPIAGREQVLAAQSELLSRAYPDNHGPAREVLTSASTGQALRVRRPGVADALWLALTLRDHFWHRRDLNAHLASIRFVENADKAGAVLPNGMSRSGWGAATTPFYPDAPCSLLSIATPIDDQLDWLLRVKPDYLLTYPSNLRALLQRIAARGVRPEGICQVRTMSEALAADLPELCEEVLGAPIVDAYTAEEVGYIALQCPEYRCYHVQSENVLVEVVDDEGNACGVGETGRVLVSSLNNYATPLVRYEIGDCATVGAPCPCGRGLPVLERVDGRARGVLRYPDGRVAFPVFTIACRKAAPFRELQLVQESLQQLRVVVAPDGELTDDHRAALTAAIVESFGHPFDVQFTVVDTLPRSKRGKLDEFVSWLGPTV